MTGGAPRHWLTPPDDEDFAELARGVQAAWLRDRLGAALECLPPDAQRAVVLRYVEGWEFEVVAEDLGIPPGDVRALCRRALATVRADLRGSP